MLEVLQAQGRVAISRREGRERIWDLAERIFPPGVEPWPAEDAERELDARRLASLGLARAKGTAVPVEPNTVGEAGEPAVIDGVPGLWRVDPAALERVPGPNADRSALLSPLDRLVVDRKRILELFDFEYTLEMYKSAKSRRWGYFAPPVLHGERLVGKLDATADRAAGVLPINALHEDLPFSPTVNNAVVDEVDALANWLGLEPGWR